MAEDSAEITPSLKITGLHIAGFRSLRQLDWPEDGLGWSGQVPDIVLVGGANGSGKTTLLEGLFGIFFMDRSALFGSPAFESRKLFPGAASFRLDLAVESQIFPGRRELRLAIGDPSFIAAQTTPDYYAIRRQDGVDERAERSDAWRSFVKAAFDNERYWACDLPRVLYFPSERRLTFPQPNEPAGFARERAETMAFRFQPAQRYEGSLVALLYDARWKDLNAKEEGRPEEAGHFAAYVDAFHRFVGGGKQLTWHRGALHVQMADGTLHDLPELSSGEKQVLIFAAELRRAWLPGSLVLIDEPELHLHEAWQTTLFEMIRDLQRERGGQAILATQSSHLFGLGEPGSRVVLRKGWP